MRKFIILHLLALLFITLVVGACSGFSQVPATQTASPLPFTKTPTPTPTQVWFPVTKTPPLHQTQAVLIATLDQRPLSNAILIEDDFSTPDRWTTIRTEYGSVAYGLDELTIALNQERTSLYSFFLEPVPDQYYLEMLVNPNLCKGKDLYGVVFRVQSNSDFYRLVLRCDGQIRVDLIRGGSVVTIVEQSSSGQLRAGAMQEIPIALWLNAKEVLIFIDGIYQFRVDRLLWSTGGIGVFARSASDSALTVSFSEFILREGQVFPPTAVPTWTPLPAPTKTPLNRP